MSSKFRYILLMLLLCYSQASFSFSGWYTGTINRIQTNEDGTVFLYVNGPASECGANDMIMNDTSSPGGKLIYSSLLTYQALKMKVQFFITRCDGTSGVFTKIESL